MVQDNRHDAIMVRFSELKEDGTTKLICAFYTTAIDQMLKLFLTAKENNVAGWFNETSSIVPKNISQFEHYIHDVYLNLGNEEDLMTIEVILT